MLVEFLLEVFCIKIKVKGYLQNLTENTSEEIDTFGIKNKNKLVYVLSSTKYKMDILKDKILLTRENDEFIHGMIFELNKCTETNYYIKSLNASISIKILTKKISISDDKIEINYQTIDNQNEYIYIIEMSDK